MCLSEPARPISEGERTGRCLGHQGPNRDETLSPAPVQYGEPERVLRSQSGQSGSCDLGTNVYTACPATRTVGASSDSPRVPRGRRWGAPLRGGGRRGALGCARSRGSGGAAARTVLHQGRGVPPAPRWPDPRRQRTESDCGGRKWGPVGGGGCVHKGGGPTPLPASLVTLDAAGKTSPRKWTATGGTASAPCCRDLASLLPARVVPRPRAGSLGVRRKP